MRRSVKMGLVGAAAVAGFGLAALVPASPASAHIGEPPAELVQVCLTIRPGVPFCIWI